MYGVGNLVELALAKCLMSQAVSMMAESRSASGEEIGSLATRANWRS